MPPFTFLPNFGPDRSGRQAAILENQLRAIDPKLCTYVLLGKSNSQTKFRSSLILGLATRGPKPKTYISPGSSPKFCHIRMHEITEVKVQNILQSCFVTI
jgi:hypothetical protein